jgi:soluble lytic murein transglycosylase-like protein
MVMQKKLRVFVMVSMLATLPLAGWGAERVTLRNGFAMVCDHHAQVESHTRLYLGAGESNFVEFATQEIVAVENVPDAPAPQKEEAAANAPHPDDAKLSPADLHEILVHAGEAHNLDADLLASVVKAESGGNPKALSHAGARGLMQLMPATANGLGVADSYKPDQNVRGGATYLAWLLDRYHDNLAKALAAYNAGPEAVDRYHGIPPYHETQVYVARVIHEFNRRVKARENALRTAKAN